MDTIGYPASQKLFRTEQSYRAFAEKAAPLLAAGKEVRTEWEFMREDGTIFVAMVSGQGINIPGFERSAVWVYEDITERKKLETEIQDAREYAENIVETVREPMVVLLIVAVLKLVFALL